MKLYIWNDPYSVNYGGAIVYAVAETVEEAKVAAAKGQRSMFGRNPRRPADMSTNALGEPTRVLDAPCAEWYEWSEEWSE